MQSRVTAADESAGDDDVRLACPKLIIELPSDAFEEELNAALKNSRDDHPSARGPGVIPGPGRRNSKTQRPSPRKSGGERRTRCPDSNTTTELTREDIVIEWEDGFHVGRALGRRRPAAPGWEFRFRREEDAGVMREWEVRFEDDAEWVAFFEHPTWVAIDRD